MPGGIVLDEEQELQDRWSASVAREQAGHIRHHRVRNLIVAMILVLALVVWR